MTRVRFAPSPTGELHIGGARTALYNYLFAKHEGGQFIIRIEDTDQERFVEGSLDRILTGLKWLGLTWDEGPDVGGTHGPYVQSQRLQLYQQQVEPLLRSGAAYWCFCTAERLEVLRQVQTADHQPTRYDRTCLKLTPDEVKVRLDRGDTKVLRLRVPEGTTVVRDIVRGEVTTNNAEVDDQVLLKSDGYPTYHLANVVDDHLMEITHVIRGEEWLPSTPKHLMLYQALGWKPPEYAHLPNVLNAKRAKLSKRRDGEAVWLATYQQQGYQPQAMVNFLAFLGWHPHDERERFSLAELCQTFELGRVQKAGAIFDLEKLNWFNGEYIKAIPTPELNVLLQPFYQTLAKSSEQRGANTEPLTELLRSRLTRFSDVTTQAQWYFNYDGTFDPGLLIPRDGAVVSTRTALQLALQVFNETSNWDESELKRALESLIRPGTLTRGQVLWPVRVALTGLAQSPDVFSVALVLGRAECAKRLQAALSKLPT